MLKFLKALLLTLAIPLASLAQNGNTTVHAIVKDPTGALYVSSQVNASFIDPGTSGKLPLISGSTFQTTFTGYGTDSFGFFQMSVPDNGVIASSSGATGTTWKFTICFKDRQTCFTYTTPINCASNIPVACSGNSMDLSTPLQAVAALLPSTGGGSSPSQGPLYTVQASNGAGQFQVTNITDNTNTGLTTIGDNLSVLGTVSASSSVSISGALAALSTASITGLFTAKGDVQFCGLNPYIDIRCYGARAVSSLPTTTASISAGSFIAILASAAGLQNGDGVVIYGAGPSNTLSAPATLTITPIVASGLIGTGEVVASLTGSTTYNYQHIGRDKPGGLTASSAVGSTSSGLATLGAITVAISSITRSNNIVTVNTASATPLVPLAVVWIVGNTDLSFNGAYQVASTPSTSQFTFLSGVDTRSGAGTSTSGGTVTYYVGNRLAWTTNGEWQDYIYGRSGGSLTLIAATKPEEGSYDDWGSTLMGSPTFPSYVPSTPPVTALNDPLTTTIVSGGGTTTLTLANSASITVASSTLKMDSTPALLAAHTVGGITPIYIPSTSLGSFPFNSYIQLNSPLNIIQAGSLTLNETFELGSGTNWIGIPGTQSSSGAVGAWSQYTPVACTAKPCVFENGIGGQTRIERLILDNENDQAIIWLVDGSSGFQHSYSWMHFVTGNPGLNEDYLGIAFEARGGTKYDFYKASFYPHMNNAGVMGLWSPAVHIKGGESIGCPTCPAGALAMYETFMGPKGINMDATAPFSSINVDVNGYYTQGSRMPLFTATQSFGGTLSNLWTIKRTTTDTSTAPLLSNLSNSVSNVYLESIGPSSGGASNVSGNPIVSLVVNVGSAFTGPNTGLIVGPNFTSNFVNVNNQGYFGTLLPAPAAVDSLVASAGGGVPTGVNHFVLSAVDINNKTTIIGADSTITIAGGTQTVTGTPPTLPNGSIGYIAYRGNNGIDYGQVRDTTLACNVIPAGTAFVDAGVLCGNSHPMFTTAAQSSLGAPGISTPIFRLMNSGFYTLFDYPSNLTSNRTIHVPNVTGTWAFTDVAQTISQKQTFTAALSSTFIDLPVSTTPGNPSAGNIRIYGDSGSGNFTCLTSAGANCNPAGGGSGTPGGSSTQVQFNSAGAFAGSVNLTYVSPALIIGSATNATGQLKLAGVTSGTVTVQSLDIAGTWTLKLPATAGTNGLPLTTDGTGVSSWAVLGYAGGGTGATSFSSNQLIASGGSSLSGLAGTTTGSNPILTLTAQTTSSIPLRLNTQPSPIGNIFDVQVNGLTTTWIDSSGFIHTPQTTYTGSGSLALSGNEGACPSSILGVDIICIGDSITHSIQISLNGGNFKPVPQISNSNPVAHSVAVWSVTFPQLNSISAGLAGQSLLSGGVGADPAFSAITLSNTASVTGILGTANGGTGSASLSAANIVTVTGAITVGHCASYTASTVITDSGAGCSGGSSPARLDQITAATNTNIINNATFAQTWGWALTGSITAFKIGEITAATGAGNILFQATTANLSTAIPFQTDNNGNGWQLSSTGQWQQKGTGTLAIPGTPHGLVISEGSTTAIATTAVGATGQILTGLSGLDPVYIDFPDVKTVPSATCNNTTGGNGWQLGSGGTVTCRAGTNNLEGYISITDTSSTFAQFILSIPEDWNAAVNPFIRFQVSSSDATNGHTIIPSINVACYKGDGTTTDDVTPNGAHSLSTITLNGNANRLWSTSNIQMNSTDITGCVAGAVMNITVGRATDTATDAKFWSATVTFPRRLLVQAN